VNKEEQMFVNIFNPLQKKHLKNLGKGKVFDKWQTQIKPYLRPRP
jgi:hypothetical protein